MSAISQGPRHLDHHGRDDRRGAAAPSSAVVGGHDASPGEYPSVAEITFGPFLCTGTLITPDWVLTAGHCGSVTGAAVATPASWPTPLINVRDRRRDPERRRAARREPGRDAPELPAHVRLRHLAAQALAELDHGADPGRRRGRAQHLDRRHARDDRGLGRDRGGRRPARQPPGGARADHDRLSTARAPTATSTRRRWSAPASPRAASTPARATPAAPCSAARSAGALRVVGTTSFGEGCARPGKPGVYGRVADDTLRPWIAQNTGTGVSTGTSRAEQAGEGPPRQAACSAAPLGAQAPRPGGARHGSLEHEGDQQDDQDDQQDRSHTDVHRTPPWSVTGPGPFSPFCAPLSCTPGAQATS